jgi:demethylmenaquinone methyltransferase / 2-methoxy-6-polyprenyl-1,4-benzoquinol methylase
MPIDAATKSSAPATGTRPEGAATEADASRQVRQMFSRIAPRYDFLNHFLSFEMDRLWRARVVNHLGPILVGKFPVVLDLCCGTGDLGLAIAARFTPHLVGVDFSHDMLVRAKAKAKRLRGKNLPRLRPPKFFEADALHLPFADQSFDLVTSAFGFRNLANYEAGLREIHRVLKPGGTVAILEFTEPPDTVLGNLYRWYCRQILPRVGGLISGDSTTYAYLPKSITLFFRPPELAALMSSVGFSSPDFRLYTFSSVALHTATRP